MKQKETDPFQVPVCETGAVEVFQTLCRPVQLPSHFSEGNDGESEVVYQFQSVDGIFLDVLHDVPVSHPL